MTNLTCEIFYRYKKDDSNVCRFKESIQSNKITALIGDHINIKLRKWEAVALAEGTCLSISYLLKYVNSKFRFLTLRSLNLTLFNYHLRLLVLN